MCDLLLLAAIHLLHRGHAIGAEHRLDPADVVQRREHHREKRQPEHQVAQPEQAPLAPHRLRKLRRHECLRIVPPAAARPIDQLVAADHQRVEPFGDARPIHPRLRQRQVHAQLAEAPRHLPGLRHHPALFEALHQALVFRPALLVFVFEISGGHDVRRLSNTDGYSRRPFRKVPGRCAACISAMPGAALAGPRVLPSGALPAGEPHLFHDGVDVRHDALDDDMGVLALHFVEQFRQRR